MFQGLRTVVYHVKNVAEAKAWWSDLLGLAPYFDEPFYVGFQVGGYELGLHPVDHETAAETGPITYWGVADVAVAHRRLLEKGASEHLAIQDVGGGIKVASVLDPAGCVVGIIENPHFRLPSS